MRKCLNALKFGADDYIVKPFNYMNLLARIKAVLRRIEAIPFAGGHNNLISSSLKIDFVDQKVKIDNLPVKLTPSEYHLLVLLIKNRGSVVPYERIMDEVRGRDYIGGNENIKTCCAACVKSYRIYPTA